MPTLTTVHFGQLEYREDTLLEFPEGLPAFDQERWFVPVEQPAASPLLFLQSLTRPELVFLTIPVEHIAPGYQLYVGEEDLTLLGLAPEQTDADKYLVRLAIVAIHEDGTVTANLMAPVVINRAGRKARQVIQTTGGYSHVYPLAAGPVPHQEPSCS